MNPIESVFVRKFLEIQFPTRDMGFGWFRIPKRKSEMVDFGVSFYDQRGMRTIGSNLAINSVLLRLRTF